ncbi:hypothetical protein F7725_005015 [Xyrichtys novacula]|uniref:Uncharacterized protein n=1 Tax=Xyrichtys novacula TaxID=13765 RepID=A0AAV1EHN9_XYRNO|nr:hypothetical protein F7725_005015 [Xyrichtys novacula]
MLTQHLIPVYRISYQVTTKPYQKCSHHSHDDVESLLFGPANMAPFSNHLPWTKALEGAENEHATDRGKNKKDNQSAKIEKRVDISAGAEHYSQPSRAQHPNACIHDVPDPGPLWRSQSQVGDGVNDSQVVIRAGQEVKHGLSYGGEDPHTQPHLHHRCYGSVATTEVEEEAQEFI